MRKMNWLNVSDIPFDLRTIQFQLNNINQCGRAVKWNYSNGVLTNPTMECVPHSDWVGNIASRLARDYTKPCINSRPNSLRRPSSRARWAERLTSISTHWCYSVFNPPNRSQQKSTSASLQVYTRLKEDNEDNTGTKTDSKSGYINQT